MQSALTSTDEQEPWQLAEKSKVWEPVPAVINFTENNIPSGAIVLFDGKHARASQGDEGGDTRFYHLDRRTRILDSWLCAFRFIRLW